MKSVRWKVGKMLTATTRAPRTFARERITPMASCIDARSAENG